MKKLSTVLPLLLGAVLITSPLAVFADEGADDAAEASVSTTGSAEVSGDSRGHNEDLLRRKADFIERAAKERRDVQERYRMGLHGSTTGERPASTSMPRKEHMENGEKGKDPVKMQERGSENIDKRIERLQEQVARIAKMERLSAEQKASITAELNAQIASLTGLKASIAAETDPTKIKELMQSVTKEHRVYAVTMPKAAITAAADRIMTVVAKMESFATKLAERVTASGSAEAQTALTDFTAKIAGAKVEAQAAASLVADLQADNGDAAVAASNTAAIKSAKEKIDAARADLKAAREDIRIILKAVRGTGESAT